MGKVVFIDLVNTYANSARYYHNLEHIHDILNHLEEIKHTSDRFVVIQLAAWFHDYVYHPQANDNETNYFYHKLELSAKANIQAEIEISSTILLRLGNTENYTLL
ncbi:MAG: hypothetical protein ACFCU5_00035 [Pleurocapsa sp.]